MVNPLGNKVAFFSVELSAEQRNALGARSKRTIIFEAELMAMVLAFSVWKKQSLDHPVSYALLTTILQEMSQSLGAVETTLQMFWWNSF